MLPLPAPTRHGRAAVVIGLLCATLAACSSSPSDAEPDTDTQSPTGPSRPDSSVDPASVPGMGEPSSDLCEGEEFTIGLDIYSDSDSTSTANIASFERVAESMGCVDTIVLVDNADPITALQNVQSLIQQQVDAVVLGQVVAAAQPGLMDALDAAGIPAVSMYITADGATFVNPSNTDSGLLAGRTLAEAFAKTSSEQPYVISGVFPDAGAASVERMGGFVDGVQEIIGDLPADHILEIDTKADPPTANAQTKSVLARIPEGAQILFSGVNDVVTYAMLQGILESGRGDDALGIGYGADPTGIEFVCSNEQYFGSVAFFPENTFDYVIPVALAAVRGQPIPAEVKTPIDVLNRENSADLYPDDAC